MPGTEPRTAPVSDNTSYSRLSSKPLGREQSRWLSGLFRTAPRSLTLGIAAPLVSGLLLVWQAWLLSLVLDRAVTRGAPLQELLPPILGVASLLMVRALVGWAGEYAASLGAECIKSRLRQALFERMLANGPQWTAARVSGELAATLIDHVEAFEGFFVRYLPSSIAAAFLPVVFGLILLPVDWIAALLLLLTAPLIPLFMALVGWGAEAASQRHQLALSRLSGLFADRLRGAFTLKLFGRTEAEVHTVRQASHDLSRKTMAVLRIAFLSSAVLEFFAALGVAGVAVYIGLSYLGYLGDGQGGISLQAGLFCLLLAPEVYSPLRQFAASYHDRAAARAAVSRLEEVFGALPALATERSIAAPDPMWNDRLQYPAGRTTGQRVTGSAEFDESCVLRLNALTVQPAGSPRPTLDRITLTLTQGHSIALVGASGSGKTTLLEAICGWRDIAGGSVSYRGRTLRDGDTLDVDDGVVLISQRPFFAPGTVADNLRSAAPHASDDELWAALRLACAHDFVRALPEGLGTALGAGGYGLSGGQLHRLALARLFLTDPELILLDEPTAHLDADTRDRVMASLMAFAAGRSLVLATHDPVVAGYLDIVWQMRAGQVAVA